MPASSDFASYVKALLVKSCEWVNMLKGQDMLTTIVDGQ